MVSMNDRHIIEIPAGQHFIGAGWLANQIAACLVHVPEGPPLLLGIEKHIPLDQPGHFKAEKLTEEDGVYLRQLWAGLDIPPAWNMTREQWANCYKTFNAAPNKPIWDIRAVFDDFHGQARGERGQAAFKHFRLLEAEAKAGKLRLLDAHRALTTKLEHDTLISIEDARDYAGPLGFALVQAPYCGQGEPDGWHAIERIGGLTACDARTYEEAIRAQLERNARGRYTLDEAAREVANHANARPESILEKLKKAVGDGLLPVYGPGLDERYQSETVRDFYEEAKASDLNQWLSIYEPGITWRYETQASNDTERNKAVSAPAGYQRLDELALEISKQTINEAASKNSELRRAIVEAFEAHAGTVKDWLQELVNKGDIQPRSILSTLPEPKPPVLEHLADWVVSDADALKIRTLITMLKARASNSPSTAPAKDAGAIPGKIPRVASGRFAVQAAWEIECATGARATAKDVIKRMQQWASEGQHGELTKSLPGNAVEWITTAGKPNSYDLGACGKTLARWHDSRQ